MSPDMCIFRMQIPNSASGDFSFAKAKRLSDCFSGLNKRCRCLFKKQNNGIKKRGD